MPGIRVKNGASQGQTFAIGDKPLIVGRDESCELSLQDKGASRQHAEIFRIGDMCFIRDLESKNGTFVNDNRVAEEMLRDGDRIQIGGTILVFEPLAGTRPEDDLDFSEDELDAFYELRLEDLTAVNVGDGDASSETYLRALYRLSRLTASECSEDGLIKKGLAFAAETLRADGAYIFGRDPQKGGVITLGSHMPKGGRTGQLSRTIIRKVLQDKRALLVTDAMRDERFSSNESVMRHHIHAVICAPMTLYEGAESVLYLAGDDPAVSFNERELELAAAMADQIGLALSNIASKIRRHEYMLSAVRMILVAADVNRPGVMASNTRLAGYARAIGKAMAMDSEAVEKLQLAAMLYNYSDMVNRDESRTEEQRTADTVDLLSREVFFPEIEDIVAYQRERCDGGGPKGLLGAEIPLEARVFHVARDLETALGADNDAGRLAAWVTGVAAEKAGKIHDPEVVKGLLAAEQSGALAMPLDDQWRARRSSRMTAFLNED